MKLIQNGDTLRAVDESGRVIGKVMRVNGHAELIEGGE